MARKSLTDQVLEELDRARGILSSLQDSSDPIPGILIGTALESLHRIETTCIAYRQRATDSIVSGAALVPVDVVQAAATELPKRKAGHRAASTKRPVKP